MKVIIELDTDNHESILDAYEMLFPLALRYSGQTMKLLVKKGEEIKIDDLEKELES